ncbi:MAG: hypothetical protein V3V68_04975 [Nitrosomonadaceae bacterium]
MLQQRLAELSGYLYRDRFHLLNTLTMAADDCGYRLGTVDMGTEDSGRRRVNVYGWPMIPADTTIMIEWTTTEYGNLEANFILS